jgi:DNA-directed RNA polymerase subunit RPC12/RpoP
LRIIWYEGQLQAIRALSAEVAGKYTPILAGVGILLATTSQLVSALVANLIGGLIFFWVNQFIFTSQSLAAQWEVRDNITCVNCGRIVRGYRLVRSGDYDRTQDHAPEFRCEECSKKKSEELKER